MTELLLDFDLSWPPILQQIVAYLAFVNFSLPQLLRLECIAPPLGEYFASFCFAQVCRAPLATRRAAAPAAAAVAATTK